MKLLVFLACVCVCVVCLSGVHAHPDFAAADPVGPSHWELSFFTDVDSPLGMSEVKINITRAWAPIGADHLFALASSGFFNSDSSTVADQGGAPFFRVAPDFVVQFGIAGTPGKNSKWTNPIKDDPVVQSNIAWTVSYATAGPDTRTTQLFINLQDNSGLDSQGFAPVGVILDRESQETVNMIMNPTPGDSMGLDQDQLMKKGDEWVKEEGYKCNYIRTTTTHINNDVPNY